MHSSIGEPKAMTLSTYNELRVLYNSCVEEFWELPQETIHDFFDIMFGEFLEDTGE